MQLNDASRIIDVIDQRIRRLTGSAARVETTWGTVAAVSSDGRYADLYLYGESAPYASEYFRLPNALSVNVGDSVKAAIDRERGDRWVEEVHAFPTYNKVEFDIVDGEVRLGGGADAPDTRLRRSGAKTLTIDDATGGAATVNVVGALQVNGTAVPSAADISSAVATHAGLADPHTGYQKESEKDQPNGYVGLNASSHIVLGGDVELYRSAANMLKTDDSLTVVGSIIGVSPVMRVYTTPGATTWNKPANLTHIIVECIGAGGAGGGAATGAAGEHSKGGGGGAGSYSRSLILAAALSASHTVTVGTGGTGVSGATGNNGGDSSFGSLVIGKGGSGGTVSGTSTATFSGALGGNGGVAGTGDFTSVGAPGGWGFGSAALATSGVGGNSIFGGGGQARTLLSQPGSSAGANGSVGGGGGGGVRTGTGAANAGGAGGDGIVIVREFYAS